MPQNSGNHVKRNSGSKLDNDKVEQLPDPVEFWKRNEQFFSMGSNAGSELLNVASKLIKENSLGYESFTNMCRLQGVDVGNGDDPVVDRVTASYANYTNEDEDMEIHSGTGHPHRYPPRTFKESSSDMPTLSVVSSLRSKAKSSSQSNQPNQSNQDKEMYARTKRARIEAPNNANSSSSSNSSFSAHSQNTASDLKLLPDGHSSLSRVSRDPLIMLLKSSEPNQASQKNPPDAVEATKKHELMARRYAPESLGRSYGDVWAEAVFLDERRRWLDERDAVTDEKGVNGGADDDNDIKLVERWDDLIVSDYSSTAVYPNMKSSSGGTASVRIPVSAYHPACWSRQSRINYFPQVPPPSSSSPSSSPSSTTVCGRGYDKVHPAFAPSPSHSASNRASRSRPYFYHAQYAGIKSHSLVIGSTVPSEPATPLELERDTQSPRSACAASSPLSPRSPRSPRVALEKSGSRVAASLLQSPIVDLSQDSDNDGEDGDKGTNGKGYAMTGAACDTHISESVKGLNNNSGSSVEQNGERADDEAGIDDEILAVLLESQRELQAIETFNYLTLRRLQEAVQRQAALDTLRGCRGRLEGVYANLFEAVDQPHMRTKLRAGLAHLSESTVRRAASGSALSEFPQMGSLWSTEVKEAEFIATLQLGSVTEAYVNDQWIATKVKRLYKQANGTTLRYVKVVPLGSFVGDFMWLAVEDGCLARPGTHLAKQFYEALGVGVSLSGSSAQVTAIESSGNATPGTTKASTSANESSADRLPEPYGVGTLNQSTEAMEDSSSPEVSNDETNVKSDMEVVVEEKVQAAISEPVIEINPQILDSVKTHNQTEKHPSPVATESPIFENSSLHRDTAAVECVQVCLEVSGETLQVFDLTASDTSFGATLSPPKPHDASCDRVETKMSKMPTPSLPKLDDGGLEVLMIKSPVSNGRCGKSKY